MNTKEELIEHVGTLGVSYVSIYFAGYCDIDELVIKGTLDEVLPLLDFDYLDNGYGSQELFGYIWYEDGTWSERDEYGWIQRERPNFDVKVKIL